MKKIYKIFAHLDLRQFDYIPDRVVRGHDMDETWIANGGTVDTTESWDECAQKCLEYQPKCKGFSWVKPEIKRQEWNDDSDDWDWSAWKARIDRLNMIFNKSSRLERSFILYLG